MFQIKNVYETSEKKDGYRILIDKLWPEGLSKEDAKVDLWLKEIAPTTDIDKCITEDFVDFEGFKEKYRGELRKKKTLISIIRKIEEENGTVTLLYSASDHDCNCAAVLRDKLNGYKTLQRSVGRLHGG